MTTDYSTSYVLSDGNYDYHFDHYPGNPETPFMCTITSKNRDVITAPSPSLDVLPAIKSSSSISLEGAFRKHYKLTNIWPFFEYLFEHDLTHITNTSCMFQECDSLKDLSPLSLLSTEYLIDASLMFSWCFRLKDLSPISNWDMTHVRNISGLFLNCTSLHDISPLVSWNLSRVRKRGYVFTNCGISVGSTIAYTIDPPK